MKRPDLAARNYKHGLSGIAEYRIWTGIIKRCTNPNVVGWHNYGGRGITISDEFRNSFVAFLSEIGPRPTRKHWIERIDNQHGYERGNIRWSTPKENNRNRRSSLIITIDGQTRTVAEWAEIAKVPADRIYKRIKMGWKSSDAVFLEVRWPIKSKGGK